LPITGNFLEVPMMLRPVMHDLASIFGNVLLLGEGRFYNLSPIAKTIIVFDLNKPIVDKVHYIVGNITYCSKVVLLNVQHTCNFCHEKGHIVKDCKVKRVREGGINIGPKIALGSQEGRVVKMMSYLNNQRA